MAVAADGSVAVRLPDRWPETLVRGGLVVRAGDGAPLLPGPPELRVDADEVELAWTSDRLALVVRHTFAAGWGLRVALSNPGVESVTLADPMLSWRVPEGRPAWALAAGAAGSYAVLPPDGTGPLLGGLLRMGSLPAVDARGLHLGPVVLAPGGRYVVQWHWEVYPGPRSLGRGRHPEVPRLLDLEVGEVAIADAGEDEALLVPDVLQAERSRGQVELSATVPGRYPVELRSARGTTTYQLRVAAPLDALLSARALAALEQPRTAAGIVRLPDVDAALAVQSGVAAGVLPDAELAEEALDLFTARLPEDAELDPRTVGYLCGEHLRTAEPGLLERAGRAVLSAGAPRPGLGLAATQLCLVLLLAEHPVGPVLEHLARVSAAAEREPLAGPLPQQAALLELEVVTMGRGGAAAPAGVPDRVADRVAARVTALGGWLGAGLTGRPVRPLPVDQLAHLTAVLALLPEDAAARHRGRWGCTAHELARRSRAAVLDRVAAEPGSGSGPALSYLLLGTRPD
nr:hypothetical protein [uncultured Friedmanniella sp.]